MLLERLDMRGRAAVGGAGSCMGGGWRGIRDLPPALSRCWLFGVGVVVCEVGRLNTIFSKAQILFYVFLNVFSVTGLVLDSTAMSVSKIKQMFLHVLALLKTSNFKGI